MVHLVPSLSFIKNLRIHLEQGLTVNASLMTTINKEETSFSQQILFWKAQYDQRTQPTADFKSVYQQSFVEILIMGLEGAPIHQSLCLLEVEMEEEFERQWKAYLQTLPVKLSLPLLFFFFPAYIILLFGPLITQFLQEVQ